MTTNAKQPAYAEAVDEYTRVRKELLEGAAFLRSLEAEAKAAVESYQRRLTDEQTALRKRAKRMLELSQQIPKLVGSDVSGVLGPYAAPKADQAKESPPSSEPADQALVPDGAPPNAPEVGGDVSQAAGAE